MICMNIGNTSRIQPWGRASNLDTSRVPDG
jgi:hypothetical protein